jgi:hypothetical protein
MNDTNALETLSQFHSQLPTAWQTHWPALMMGAAAVTHFAHLAWPKIQEAWPYIASHGGIKGIIHVFFNGEPKP